MIVKFKPAYNAPGVYNAHDKDGNLIGEIIRLSHPANPRWTMWRAKTFNRLPDWQQTFGTLNAASKGVEIQANKAEAARRPQ